MSEYTRGFILGVLLTVIGCSVWRVHRLIHSDPVRSANTRWIEDVDRIACQPGEHGVIVGGSKIDHEAETNDGQPIGDGGFLQVSCYKNEEIPK